MQMHRVLKPTGTLYLHCDWHAGHYLKVMTDGIFGTRNFRNEVAWCYAGGGVPKKDFPRKHDTILRYTKSDEYFFAPIYRAYSEGTVQRGRTQVKGKYFEEGLRPEGTPINDWWTDVPRIISPNDSERLGYPTQKPEALLDRIITVSSQRGDVVLDPFCGCGTAVAVAHRLERQWIGMDISPTAVEVMRRRLEKQGATVDLEGLPVTEDDLRLLRPFEFQNWVINRVQGTPSPRKVGDMGIDGYSFMENLPIQVKQSAKVGRNVVDNFETAVERSGKHKGYIIAFSFTRNAREEAARAKAEKGMEVELLPVSTLVKGPPNRVTPELAEMFPALPQSYLDLPVPTARPKADRPSVDQLVLSDKALTMD